jgi:hypothetical protein
MSIRTRTTLLVCLAVVFAGCGGVIDSVEDRAKDAAKDAASDALNESGVTDFDTLTNATMIGFGFDQPATYIYEITVSQNVPNADQPAHGRLVVAIEEVSGDMVTLTTRYEVGDETIERTFSGSQQEVAAEFGTFTPSTNASLVMRTLRAQTTLAITLGHSLYLVEHGFPASEALSRFGEENNTVTYDAAGTDSYAGVTCSVTVFSVNGSLTAESCVSTDLGLPVYVVLYGENGTPSVRVELVEYDA